MDSGLTVEVHGTVVPLMFVYGIYVESCIFALALTVAYVGPYGLFRLHAREGLLKRFCLSRSGGSRPDGT